MSLIGACAESKMVVAPVSPITTTALFGHIAFVSTRDGSPYIYVDSVGDSTVRGLTRGENPAWSPDGLQLVFNEVSSGDSEPTIRIINVDGSSEHVLPLNGTAPTWSPDGTKLAFATSLGIYVANADGSTPTRLVANDFAKSGEKVSDPSWSPDGTSLAFVRWSVDNDGGVFPTIPTIYIVRADGSAPRALVDGLSLPQRRPRWSPGGGSIAYQTEVQSGALIVTEYLDGSGVRTRAAGPPPIEDPDWSADGYTLSFSQSAGAQSRLRIFVTDTRSGATRQLIPDAAGSVSAGYDDYQGAWSHAKGPWDY
jgi:Tol biopolymer transport system component